MSNLTRRFSGHLVLRYVTSYGELYLEGVSHRTIGGEVNNIMYIILKFQMSRLQWENSSCTLEVSLYSGV